VLDESDMRIKSRITLRIKNRKEDDKLPWQNNQREKIMGSREQIGLGDRSTITDVIRPNS
jgi:hypothetical protein